MRVGWLASSESTATSSVLELQVHITPGLYSGPRGKTEFMTEHQELY